MLKIKAFVKDMLWNASLTCLLCRREIFDGTYFCPNCKDSLINLDTARICGKCGRKTQTDTPYCLECKKDFLAFDKARAAFGFDNSTASLIYGYKDGGGVYLSEVFAHYMLKVFDRHFFRTELIVPVPAADEDILRRGFDHAHSLAKIIALKTGTPLAENAVVKVASSSKQKTLTKKQRFENAQKLFRLKRRAVFKGKTVLIIDDVLTTGATAGAIAQKLKAAGAAAVYVLTFVSVAVSKDVHKTN